MQTPVYWVAASMSHNEVLVSSQGSLSLFSVAGVVTCQWIPPSSQELKISANGEWLGSLNFGKVELWTMKSLKSSCTTNVR